MGLIVKICGLSTEETLDAALDAGADMIGFMFFPRSPRYVSPGAATRLAARAHGRTQTVAVTVDMADDEMARLVETVGPDWLQLHGREGPERVAAIKTRFGLPVIKAIGVRDANDLATAAAYAGIADRLLLDAKPPKDADRPGGLGVPFDWTLLAGLGAGTSYLLSGGLNSGNVGEALHISRAPGVDVSSGVETAPGVKDPALITAFVAAARDAAMSSPQLERQIS